MSGREGLLLNGEQDQVPLGEIVQLSQIRGDRNRVTTALKETVSCRKGCSTHQL